MFVAYVDKANPVTFEAAVTELREIANGRGDLLAELAGVTLGFYARENREEWPRKALEAALCIAAGADLACLTEWIAGVTARYPPLGPRAPIARWDALHVVVDALRWFRQAARATVN